MTEFRLGKHTIKFTPHKIIPVNSNHEVTKWIRIEVHQKGILRSSKLVKSMKYMPAPALTIMGFLDTLTNQTVF